MAADRLALDRIRNQLFNLLTLTAGAKLWMKAISSEGAKIMKFVPEVRKPSVWQCGDAVQVTRFEGKQSVLQVLGNKLVLKIRLLRKGIL